MTAEWHYARGQEKVGPVTEERLKELGRSGELARTDMVWTPGMAKWQRAGEVEGLFDDELPQAMPGSAPPLLPVVPVAARSTSNPVLPWPVEERNGFSLKQWIGIGATGFMALIGLVFVVESLVQGGQGLCCGPMVFCAIGLVLWLSVFNGWMIHGRWLPADGAGGWVELLKGGVFKREDGMVGTFTLLKNKKFIDLFVSGHLVDSWRILSWGMDRLEIQDGNGKHWSFKKGKTLAEKQASFFHSERTEHLPGSWLPADGSGEWVQFTEDGAVVYSDGKAGRYTVTGEEPNEVVRVKLADGSACEYRVMSLSKTQLVIVKGTHARTYNRSGPAKAPSSASGAAHEPSDQAQTDEAPGRSVGSVVSGVWNWFSGKERCPGCKSRNTSETGRTLQDQRQEVRTDWRRADGRVGHRPQAVFNVQVWEVRYKCAACGNEWLQDEEKAEMA